MTHTIYVAHYATKSDAEDRERDVAVVDAASPQLFGATTQPSDDWIGAIKAQAEVDVVYDYDYAREDMVWVEDGWVFPGKGRPHNVYRLRMKENEARSPLYDLAVVVVQALGDGELPKPDDGDPTL